MISVQTDEQWRILCRAMEREDLATDVRFTDRLTRCRHNDELDRLVEQWTLLHHAEEITERLQAEGVPAGVVKNAADLMQDTQLRYRNYFERLRNSQIGPVEVPRSAFQFQGLVDESLSPAPDLGEHTDEIMRDVLSYDAETIERWKAEGILA